MARDWLPGLISDALDAQGFRRLGVAVSGGGDSVALLHLMRSWAKAQNVVLQAVTVDHGLRAAAADEAAFVADICAGLGIAHQTLRWDGWSGQGNLQDQARRARYRLIGDWATAQRLEAVALGHTLEDQAETVLMRLARSAGVDGLSAMQEQSARDGMIWLRPLLQASRAALRIYLERGKISWIEDPSNIDPKFERVRMRAALGQLEPLGITPAGLSTIARNMRGARDALGAQTNEALQRFGRVDAGALVIDRSALDVLPPEILRRLLTRAVAWINGDGYPPRHSAVSGALNAARLGRDATLEGCHLHPAKGALWLFRELKAAPPEKKLTAGRWDNRWDIEGPEAGCVVAPLGAQGLQECPEWRYLGRPYKVLLSSPAIWKDGNLVAAPFAGAANGWRVTLAPGKDQVINALLSH